MAKKIIQMYDKYQSTTKVYPKVIEECLPEDVQEKINKGGIPTITIDATQMLSQTTAQLTNEQYELLVNEGVAIINLPLGQKLTIVKVYDIEGSDIVFSSTLDYDSDVQKNFYWYVAIDRETKVASIVSRILETGKQLYQHNIYITSGSSYDYTISIISEDNTVITGSNIASKLTPYLNKNLVASGWYMENNVEKIISRAVFIRDNGVSKMKLYHTKASSIEWLSYNVSDDSVLPL